MAISWREQLDRCRALRKGHFLLSSGLHSDTYVQCALFLQDPSRARLAGEALSRRLARFEPESVLSPAIGGLLIGHEVAAALGVRFRFVERQQGRMVMHRGFEMDPGERIVVVEDVVTTGKSTIESASVAEAAGARVAAVGAIIDRSGGQRLFDVPFESLLALDLVTFESEVCPQCRQGLAVEKPGSR